MKRFVFLIPIFSLLSGCNSIANWADDVGKHMPTIGEPCYHWQCFTESGQKKSDELKKIDEKPEEKAGEKESSKPPAQGSATPLSINN